MNSKWLICLPFIMTPSALSLAQQIPDRDTCVKIGEEDFTDNTITLCPSSLPPIKTIHVEGSSGDAKAQEPDCNTAKIGRASCRERV